MTSGPQHSEYRPFPSFAEWARTDVSLQDVSQSANRFRQVMRDVPAPELDASLEKLQREAAVDTNAIEGVFQTDRGFTRTVALRLADWESQMEAKGPHARAAFEDTLAGFEYVLDAMTGATPVTERWLRELHSVMLRSQDSFEVQTSIGPQTQKLPKGEYKTHPNSPTRPDGSIHPYAPVDETPVEMARLVSEMRSEEFVAADSVLKAAYAHFAFVCIHPFADGNGRIARALASVFLYQDPGVPLVIYQDLRSDYLQALEAADHGHPLRFIRFIAERVTDSINLVLAELTSPVGPEPAAERLAEAMRPTRVRTELHDAARRLQEILYTEIRSRLDQHGEELGLKLLLHRNLIGSPARVPDGYTAFGDDFGLTEFYSVKSPTEILRSFPISIAGRSGDAAVSDLVAVAPTGYRIEAFGRELEPRVTESMRERARVFADGVVEAFLTEVARAYEE